MKTTREQRNPILEGRAKKTPQEVLQRDRVSSLRPLTPAAPRAKRVINFTVVYEDDAMREWARGTCEQMFAGAGGEEVQSTWWRLDGLSDPAVLAGAVSKAMRADVIVVAIRVTEGFPLPFYVWVGSWLPHRMQREGKLVALTSAAKPRGSHSNRVVEYLRTVAQRAGMHFSLQERTLTFEARDILEERGIRRRPATMPPPSETPALLDLYPLRRYRMAA
jgi:hypothetical protein